MTVLPSRYLNCLGKRETFVALTTFAFYLFSRCWVVFILVQYIVYPNINSLITYLVIWFMPHVNTATILVCRTQKPITQFVGVLSDWMFGWVDRQPTHFICYIPCCLLSALHTTCQTAQTKKWYTNSSSSSSFRSVDNVPTRSKRVVTAMLHCQRQQQAKSLNGLLNTPSDVCVFHIVCKQQDVPELRPHLHFLSPAPHSNAHSNACEFIQVFTIMEVELL